MSARQHVGTSNTKLLLFGQIIIISVFFSHQFIISRLTSKLLDDGDRSHMLFAALLFFASADSVESSDAKILSEISRPAQPKI